jgi:CelD/BcsL family acetyltransferase involved in cellulose biosynthesis
MPVEWVSDPHVFVTLDWSSLVEEDSEATVFHSPRFLKPYWEEFGAGALRVAVVQQGAEDVAVAAFDIRDRTLTFLGGFDVTDYMGPVGSPPWRERASKELMSALVGLDGWDRADLRGLPQDGGWLRCLHRAAADAGLAPEVRREGVAPYLELPSTFDGYLAGLQSKRRHEIRRKDRRLREALPEVRLRDSVAETMAADLDVFMALHRSSVGEKGRFMVPGMELFFRRLAVALLPDGTLRLAFLEAEGEPLAGAFGFRDGNRFRLYNSAYDRSKAPVAPGMVLIAYLIRSAIEEGRSGLDFLKGDLGYKYRFGARQRPLAALALRRS